ncbi:MAG: hypothetical protein AAGN82_17255 [Myxococcota bacterium]
MPLHVIVVDRSGAGVRGPIAVHTSTDDPSSSSIPTTSADGFGPPAWRRVTVSAPSAGAYTVRIPTDDGLHCASVTVAAAAAEPRSPGAYKAVWPYEATWDARYEGLFGAWIEHLFAAPLGEALVWPALSAGLRDPARNFLFGHLGLGEDDEAQAPKIEPDCADLPYTLRAYFAFKLGLPFGYSSCTRGSRSRPPSCRRWTSSQKANDGSSGAIRRLGNFLRVRLANGVHSGTVRVRGDDDTGDFYPVRLDAESLRPGTVFADPYGHILVVVKRVPQTANSGGLLLAVDGQPDATVSRRRFWRGNFLFADDPIYGGPGFKRFRPVAAVAPEDPRPLTNVEIAAHPGYGDYDLEQYALGVDGFYDRIDRILSPRPRDPRQAFLETITALEEQVTRRVVSVDNGVAHRARHGTIDMPEGSEIFQTEGDWEDFSTPSRDMRLLIAMHVTRTWPARVADHPERWAHAGGDPPGRRDLEALLKAEAERRTFSYTRSDGSAFTLSLADVLDRAEDFEMAYNPNDCPERRWAAPEGSDEASTCRLRAPADQRRRMRRYRAWFASRQRPPGR